MENMVLNPLIISSFYSQKKVFITGHTGFKGSWLTAIFNSFGAITKGYSLAPNYKNGLFDYLQNADHGLSVINDIRNKPALEAAILEFQPDFIFHLAAQPLVRRSYEIPAETFEVNVIGTANLLEAVAKLPNKCSVIVITTDKVYKNKEKDILYKEGDDLGGYDPYSSSKACAELVVESFRQSFFNPGSHSNNKGLATARAGNVIGGGDYSDNRIIPDIIRSLSKNEAVLVRNPSAIRPWQHVLEALAGYIILGMKLDKESSLYSSAFNFGPLPHDHLPVQDLVEISIKLWGEGTWKNISDPTAVHEAGILQLDISKAMEKLSWKPKLNAYEAIEWTINWYKCPDTEKLKFTQGQIEEYFLK